MYIKKELSKHITEVVTEYVETGLHGLMVGVAVAMGCGCVLCASL